MNTQTAASKLNADIWNGNYWGPDGALARGKVKYDASRKRIGDAIPWMSLLYSALGNVLPGAKKGEWRSIRYAAWCIWQLRPLVQRFAMAGDAWEYNLPSADQGDVASAVLLKWSSIPVLGWGWYADAARRYALMAYHKSADEEGGHTHALVALTLARICLRMNDWDTAKGYLAEAESQVGSIASANQRSRVYRGIAEVTLQATRRSVVGMMKALDLLDAADATPGIGDDVRVKNDAIRKDIRLPVGSSF